LHVVNLSEIVVVVESFRKFLAPLVHVNLAMASFFDNLVNPLKYTLFFKILIKIPSSTCQCLARKRRS
jgi:hypothetical protein